MSAILTRLKFPLMTLVMLGLIGCAQYKTACEPLTLDESLTEPLPALIEPVSSSCGDLLESYVKNNKLHGICRVRYQSLIEAIQGTE